MGAVRAATWLFLLATVSLVSPVRSLAVESFLPWIKPEQRKIHVRHPSQLPHIGLPETPRPPTVSDLQWEAPERNLSLDEAIRDIERAVVLYHQHDPDPDRLAQLRELRAELVDLRRHAND